jgi:hypothetical protein
MRYLKFFDQSRKVSPQDQRLIESIRALETIRPVGRGVAIDAKDVVQEMQALRRKVLKPAR